jgi:hypothetical protein
MNVERQQSTAAAIDAWVEEVLSADRSGGRSQRRKITTAAIDGWLEDLDGGGRSGRVCARVEYQFPCVFKCISLIEAVCAEYDAIGKCISLIDAVYQFPSVFALDLM